MMTTVASWETKRVLRKTPGPQGLLAQSLLLGIVLLPWQRLGLFESFIEAAVVLCAVYAFLTAANFASESGVLGIESFWLFQKGVGLGDYALARLLVVLCWGLAFVVTAGLVAALAVAIYSEARPSQLVLLIGAPAALYVQSAALYFVMGAFRLQRKSELLVVIVLLTLTQRILFQPLGAAVQRIVHWVLPPLAEGFTLWSSLLNGSWPDALVDALHVLVYVAACAGAASLAHRRWRP